MFFKPKKHKLRLVCTEDGYDIQIKEPFFGCRWYTYMTSDNYLSAKEAFEKIREFFLNEDELLKTKKEKKKAIRIKFLYHPLPSDDPNISGDK